MQFIKDKELYKIIRNTGITHNFLAIRLAKTKSSIKVTPLEIKNEDNKKLDDKKIVSEILLGLEEINQELKKEYFISEIQVILSDSKPESIYKYLIQELIKKIDNKEVN